MTDPEMLLRVHDLTVSYNGTPVVEHISFEVKRGSTLALIGPNGSGKTTLMRALLDLVPYRGTVTWAPGLRISYVPQSTKVDADLPLTVAEFFSLRTISRTRTAAALSWVGMSGHEIPDRLIGALSGGQLQRVMIAWSLATDPHVLLVDEPTSGIDSAGQESIYALIDRISHERNLTVLLISHDLHVVTTHADTVLCVNREMVCHGNPTEVLTPHTLATLYGSHVSLYSHIHER